MDPPQAPGLSAMYFDGRSARPHAVTLQLRGDVLLVTGEDIHRAVALRDVQWPERTRHGMRAAYFSGGGGVQCADAAAWDAWSRSSGRRDSLVVRMQQSWRWVLASMLALALMLVALYQWGLPAASRAVVAAMPLSVDQSLGEASLRAVDAHLMRLSKLPLGEQERLRAALMRATSALPAGTVPAWQLVFRESRIGPNALALPGGTLVMTDQLVELVGRDDKLITAVLAHELGHVRHRHGLRLLVQATVLGALAAVMIGDFNTMLAGVPVLLGQAGYSRDAEREADAEAVRILRAAAISPDVMLALFEKLDQNRRRMAQGKDKAQESGTRLGIGFSSHPADAERVRYFREAAAGR